MIERSGLYALAFLLAGALIILIGALAVIVFLASQNCGSDFNYYACEAPTANINK